jgi:hypothetical protein
MMPAGLPWEKYSSDIVAGAYICMMIVIVAVSVSAMVLDRIPARGSIHFAGDRYFPYVLAALIVVASVFSIRTVSEFYLCSDKTLTLAKIDDGYYWAAYALPLCLVSACLLRNWLVAALCVLMLGADIFIGFRVNAAICFLSLCVLIGSMLFSQQAIRDRLCRHPHDRRRRLVCGEASLLRLKEHLCYRLFDRGRRADEEDTSVTIREGTNSAGIALGERTDAAKAVNNLSRAFLTGGTYSNSILNSEPFVIQAILNETVKEGFSTGSFYLLNQVLASHPADHQFSIWI